MRITVVCRDPLLREGIRSLLSNEAGLSVAGAVEQVSALNAQIAEVGHPVLVVSADSVETKDWGQLTKFKEDTQAEVILLVANETSGQAMQVADSIVRRTQGASGLVEAARRHAGFPVGVREALGNYNSPRLLTRREMEVAQLVAQGMPNRRIASVLNLQEQSIKNLVSGIMRKLDCENRVQVALRLTGRVAAPPEKAAAEE